MQHRKTQEDIAQRDFLEAEAQMLSEISKLEKMQQQIADAREMAFRQQSEGGKASPALTQVDDFIQRQDIRIERQKEKIKECESLVENLREILRQRAIDYKMIESLKNRRQQEFKTEVRKREQKELDNLSVMRFRREDQEK